MASPLRGRMLAAATALPLLAGLAACSSEGDKGNSNNPCASNISTPASTPLPSNIPSPSGGVAYDYRNQGKTQVWFVAVDGTADQLVSMRDAYDTQLTGQGYNIKGHDQEAGAEAESEFSGPHEGTTNFRVLCTGKVVLRLKVTS